MNLGILHRPLWLALPFLVLLNLNIARLDWNRSETVYDAFEYRNSWVAWASTTEPATGTRRESTTATRSLELTTSEPSAFGTVTIPTFTPSATYVHTEIPTANIPTPTATQETPTATATHTSQPTSTATCTPTQVATSTPTPTPTITPSPGSISNDDIGSALVIDSFPFSVTLDTTKASTSADDPNMGIGAGTNSNTVWFRMIAPSDGGISADTSGSNYDTVLAAYTGSRGNLNLVASNDDSALGTVTSHISFNVHAGETYYLEVAQYGAISRGGSLHLQVNLGDAVEPTPTASPTASVYPSYTPTSQSGFLPSGTATPSTAPAAQGSLPLGSVAIPPPLIHPFPQSRTSGFSKRPDFGSI